MRSRQPCFRSFGFGLFLGNVVQYTEIAGDVKLRLVQRRPYDRIRVEVMVHKSAPFARTRVLILAAILLVAAALRLYGLNWDGAIAAHPDERYVVGVAAGMRCSGRPNPFDVAPDYAYGHLPLYLLAAVSGLFPGADPLLLGRALAALFDLGTLMLTFALGRRLYGRSPDAPSEWRLQKGDGAPSEWRLRKDGGVLATALVALMVLHVQQAHFYTVDVPLAFFTMGALFFAARLAERGRRRDALLAGTWAGLALGTKSSALLLALPLAAASVWMWSVRGWPASRTEPHGDGSRWRRGLETGVAALITFALTSPFALLAFPTFWRNVAQQAAIARGVLDVPYTRQFHATWPYVYPVVQQLRWGMGWSLGLCAFAGLIAAVWRAVKRPPRPAEWVLLAWVLPCFAFTGALYAKYPRYLLPLTPLLALYAARLLLALHRRARRLGMLLIAVVLVNASLRCLALANLYGEPHPWLSASGWVYAHVEPGAVIAVEEWDHPLPLDPAGYTVRQLPVFDEDTPRKWARMEEILAQADYVLVASRRGYATLARWPERYPRTTSYYRGLFEGELGFEPVARFGRHPRLGPVAFVDAPAAGLNFSLPEVGQPESPRVSLSLGRLDESAVVYDHPQVLVFRRR